MVPDAPAGVMVTLMVAVAPGLMTIGENVAAGLVEIDQRSPVADVTAGSNLLVVAVMAILTVPAGAPPAGYGPHSLGRLDQLYLRLASVTGREVDEIRADARRGRYLTADEAVSYGLIHGPADTR